MRLLPASLFGRLVLILLGGLIVAQLATSYINLAERDQLLYRAGGMRLAQQISDIVKLLDSLPDAERRRVVAVFNAPPLAVTLDRPPVADDRPSAEADFQRTMFTTVLQYALGEDVRMIVVRADSAPERLRPVPHVLPPGEMPMMPGRGWGRGMAGPHPGAAFFTVQVALHDGTWVTFDSSVSPQDMGMPLRLAATLLVLLATVLVVSLVAVRWVTGPLTALAGAAEKLGEDINRPPLPETGPVEARRAARAFNTMQQRLARLIADRTLFFSAMSHDLKTPITRLRLRSELLDDEVLKANFAKDLGEMEAMVSQTLDFLRDAGTQEAMQHIDMMALLERLKTDYQDTGRNVEIKDGIAQPCMGRPLALRRCLSNLVDNAIRYGGNAAIVVEDAPDRLLIRILDDGPGIPEQHMAQAFEPFFRGEDSRNRETGGSGLGLGIARNIARAHGGDIELRNRPEGGLEATLSLPRTAES